MIAPHVPVLGYDAAAAAWHASERARLAGSGKTPSFVDGQIAAIAWVARLACGQWRTLPVLANESTSGRRFLPRLPCGKLFPGFSVQHDGSS